MSPHLSIYRAEITMVMSIVHRITGTALYVGMLLLAWWLVAAASGPRYYAFVQTILTSWPGRLVMFGFTWALLHHLLGGVRHLIWDTGRALDPASADRLAWMTVVGSAGLTVILWLALIARGV